MTPDTARQEFSRQLREWWISQDKWRLKRDLAGSLNIHPDTLGDYFGGRSFPTNPVIISGLYEETHLSSLRALATEVPLRHRDASVSPQPGFDVEGSRTAKPFSEIRPDSQAHGDDQFWVEFEKVYERGPGQTAWNQERHALKDILTLLETDVAPRYKIESPLGVGGAAVVLKVLDMVLETPRALKLARPIEGREALLSELVAKEISRLR